MLFGGIIRVLQAIADALIEQNRLMTESNADLRYIREQVQKQVEAEEKIIGIGVKFDKPEPKN